MAGSCVWWVNVLDPSERVSPDLGYIENAIFDAEHDQVIVSQFYKFEAFGPEGFRWAIHGAQFDGIQLSEPDGHVMRASGDSIFALPKTPFAFDLRTGQPLEGPVERIFGGPR